MTDHDAKLRMICEGKQPRREAVPIGQVLGGRFSRDLASAGAGGAMTGRLRAAVDEAVDGTFRQHCRSIALRGNTLTIGLDDPGCVATFKREYLFALRAHLTHALPEARVSDIRFEVSP